MANGTIALLCILHPASPAKQQRCLDLLRKSAREYYRAPEANCTSWSYSTPPPLLKSDSLTVCGLEIYTTKQAFSDQLKDPIYFQSYRNAVEQESLYQKPAEHIAWYPAAGFVARHGGADTFGSIVISLSRFDCINSEAVLQRLREFATWVHENEPDVLTYAVFKRPKAPNEVLLFVRYKNFKALRGHDGAPQHQAVVKDLTKHMTQGPLESTTLWEEVEDSFVSNVVGGDHKTGHKL